MKKITPFYLCILLYGLIDLNWTFAQQAPVQLTPTPQKVYLFGLPIVAQVQVKNISGKNIEVFHPAKGTPTLGGSLKKEGEAEALKSTIVIEYFERVRVAAPLDPGEVISGAVDLGLKYDDDISPGRYVGELTLPTHKCGGFSLQRSLPCVQGLTSSP